MCGPYRGSMNHRCRVFICNWSLFYAAVLAGFMAIYIHKRYYCLVYREMGMKGKGQSSPLYNFVGLYFNSNRALCLLGVYGGYQYARSQARFALAPFFHNIFDIVFNTRKN